MQHPSAIRLGRVGVLGAMVVGLLGCAGTEVDSGDLPEGATTTSEAKLTSDPVTVTSQKDSSASPVHIQIKTCTTTEYMAVHSVECSVDPEYALVGGGAEPIGPAFLTENRPASGRTWRASAVQHMVPVAHALKVYAIGMRLDGANTQSLVEAIRWKNVQTNGNLATVSVDSGYRLLGGGAQTNSASVSNNRFLTDTFPSTYQQWKAGSTHDTYPAAGTSTAWLLEIKDQIIEGFGGLELKILTSNSNHVSSGVGTASVQVESGWALIGMGASVQKDANQTARMLVSVRPGSDARSVTVSSRDQTAYSAGTTIAYAIQARKRPSTHGLCNPGTVVDRNADNCVNSICNQRSQCCTSRWDSTCVSMVASVCGRSCTEHTCTRTAFEPQKWTYPDGTVVPSNCYSYAQNKYFTGMNGAHQEPGYTLGISVDYTGYSNFSGIVDLAAGDGLIPTTLSATCPDNRTKVFLYGNAGNGANPPFYHWERQDSNGLWSDKFGSWGAPVLTEDTGGRPQNEVPQSSQVEAYFCACNHPLPAQLPPR